MIIKICGLKTREAVDAVVEGGADMAGFIFFEKSPRHLDAVTAAGLAARAKAGGLETVAVTVDAGDAELDAIIATMMPDWVQCHGAEPPERLAWIKARHGVKVMKALAISEVADLDKLLPHRGVADRLLLDAKPPKGSDLPGGNAVSFDWSILGHLTEAHVAPGIAWLLAGGIDAGNVATAIATANPPGLDVSSGVESAPGVKDAGKIRRFLAVVSHDA